MSKLESGLQGGARVLAYHTYATCRALSPALQMGKGQTMKQNRRMAKADDFSVTIH